MGELIQSMTYPLRTVGAALTALAVCQIGKGVYDHLRIIAASNAISSLGSMRFWR